MDFTCESCYIRIIPGTKMEKLILGDGNFFYNAPMISPDIRAIIKSISEATYDALGHLNNLSHRLLTIGHL